MVGRRTGGLDDIDILTANILVDFDVSLTVGERTDGAFAERNANTGTNRGCQFDIRISREDFH